MKGYLFYFMKEMKFIIVIFEKYDIFKERKNWSEKNETTSSPHL